MKLRTQALAWVLGLGMGLGALGSAVLTDRLTKTLDDLERDELQRDGVRVAAALKNLVDGRAFAVREFAQWTDLRDHVLGRNPGFEASNLSADSVAASGMGWLVILDGRQHVLREVAVSAEPPAQFIPRGGPDGSHCALNRRVGHLWVECRLDILDSEGRGPAAGELIAGEILDEERLQALSNATGLALAIVDPNGVSARQGVGLPGLPGLQWRQSPEVNRLQWPLLRWDGVIHSWMQVDVPRSLHLSSQPALRGAQWIAFGIPMLLSLLLALFVDQSWVRRLRGLRDGLRRYREGERWDVRLDDSGDDEISDLAREANHLRERIVVQMDELRQRSLHDVLTGLANRRALNETAHAALSRAARSGLPVALMLLDVDHFKRFNDVHGHPAGDAALRALAGALRGVSRRGTDLAFRWGGEEFGLLLEDTDVNHARQVFENLRSDLARLPAGETEELRQRFTVSAGLALARPGESLAQWIERADAVLYRAKRTGRDRLEVD